MQIDLSRFEIVNITDTCSVWNIVSSQRLLSAAFGAKCQFCITDYVLYECLYKPRTNSIPKKNELRDRLRRHIKNNLIQRFQLAIEDLQEIELLENRKRLGKGELSSIAFAKKIKKSFLTDDQKARKLATQVLGREFVQTTAHLFGWLFFTGVLNDGDKHDIVVEHESFQGPLRPYFEESYREALRCRLLLLR